MLDENDMRENWWLMLSKERLIFCKVSTFHVSLGTKSNKTFWILPIHIQTPNTSKFTIPQPIPNTALTLSFILCFQYSFVLPYCKTEMFLLQHLPCGELIIKMRKSRLKAVFIEKFIRCGKRDLLSAVDAWTLWSLLWSNISLPYKQQMTSS